MPTWFWGEAVTTAVYILNRGPTKIVVGMTPYEAWCKRKPVVHHLQTFCCVIHVKKTGGHVSKLDDRSSQMVFIGYESDSKAYRVPITKKVCVTRDIVFEEDRAWDWKSMSETDALSCEGAFDVVYDQMELGILGDLAQQQILDQSPEVEESAEAVVPTYDFPMEASAAGEIPSTPVTNPVVGNFVVSPDTEVSWRAPVKM